MTRFLLRIALFPLLLQPLLASVVINEFMASNGSSVVDEQFRHEDWIELYNSGNDTVDLGGWGLSDNAGNPFKWTFPEGTLIAPQGFLLVWASGHDRAPGDDVPGILREVWTDISGTTVETLLADPRFPDAPDIREFLTYDLEAPTDYGDDYGQRLRAVLIAPQTGNYRFWIASDDDSRLLLSTDEDPSNAVVIAHVEGWTNPRQWTKYASQQSPLIHLQAGQRYYLEVLMKEAVLGDNLCVRWQLPDNTIEEPVPATHFVSPLPTQLHTNFRLSSSGEDVVLTRPDGTTEDFVSPVPLPRDVSYGRLTDGGAEWHYLSEATPGAPNTAEAVFMPPTVTFSEPRGFKDAPIQVTMTASDPEAIIRYTTDGSEPGPSSTVYTEPVTINQTTLLRASANSPGMIPLPPTTASYLYLSDILQQRSGPPGWPANLEVNNHAMRYGFRHANMLSESEQVRSGLLSIPTISMVTDFANLFDPEEGIYSNSNRSHGWERPVSVELIDPNGEPSDEFQVDAGLRLRGGLSRRVTNPKHSFRVFFRSARGEGGLDFPLFGDEGPSEFSKIDLRTEQNYSWSWQQDERNTFLREVFSRDSQRDMGMPYTRSRYYHLYINGQYWGLYMTQERGEADWAATHLGGDSNDWDCVKTGQPGYKTEPSDGTVNAFYTLHQIAVGEGFEGANAGNYWRVKGRNPDGTPNPDFPVLLDEDNLINYMLIAYYVGDRDGPVSIFANPPHANNMYGLFNRANPDGFKWLRHDAEHSLGVFPGEGPEWDPTFIGEGITAREYFNPATLHWQLSAHPDYRMRFADLVHKHLHGDGALTPENAKARVQGRVAEIDLAIFAESARWGQGKMRDLHWVPARDAVLAYLDERRDFIVEHFRGRGWFPVTPAPQFDASGSGVTVIADHAFYYTTDGSDPRLPGGAINPSAVHVGSHPHEVQLSLAEAVDLKARAHNNGEWSPLAEMSAELPEGMPFHEWNFEDAANFLLPSLSVGGATLSVHPGPETEVVRNTAAQDFDSAHLRVNFPLGAEVILAIPTSGYQHIRVDYDTRRSGSGAGEQTVEYTTDGVEWTLLETYEVFDAAPQRKRLNLANIPSVDNNPGFALRITFGQGSGGTVGNNRFDNIVVSGSPIPGAPVLNPEALPALPLVAGQNLQVDLTELFTDSDSPTLDFSASSSEESVAAVAVQDGVLTITPHAAGEVAITVTADDGEFEPVEATFTLLVYPAAHDLAASPFAFTGWGANEPAMTYPDHMIFLQSEGNDPGLTAELGRAYQIPLADAAAAVDAEFPYAASSRTRINGLGGDGMAFINTGRGRDVGAALVALDTTGVGEASVSFTAGTVTANVRVYAIRLQYRVGSEGEFTDVLDTSDQPVEYVRNGSNGHTLDLGPVPLPEDALDEPHVQLLWRYYFVSGGSGARAQLRLDDIHVAAVGDEPSTPREAWLLQHGFPADGSLDGADEADPDGDGIPNIFERALGLDPRSPDVGWQVETQSEGGEFSITYQLARGQTDLVVTPMGAHSLTMEAPAVWLPVEPVLVDDSHPDHQLWRATISQEPDAGFLRLEVTSP